MDRTRWVGIGVLAFLGVTLGATWFIVNARADGPASEVMPLTSPAESATVDAASSERGAAPSSERGAAPAPTWRGEADAEPAVGGAPTSEAASEATEDPATEVPGGPEAPVALEPVRVEPPASGVDGDYTEDEYRAVYEELNRRSVQLALAPDPDQIDLFFSERCACYSDYRSDLSEGQASGTSTTTEPALVLAFDLLTVEDDGSFIARVVDQQQPGRAVDEQGTVVSESGIGKPFESNIRVSPEDGVWKVSQIDYVTEGSPNDPPSPSGPPG